MTKKISIAIDGPSAAGKSTIAKAIAKKYGYIYIDTGAMYRCVALACKKNRIDWQDEAGVAKLLNKLDIVLSQTGNIYLNGEDVTLAIRQNDISLGASCVSKNEAVRKDLVARQRAMAKADGVVLDGRDIGTVVLPDADLKIYQEASVAARAKRRYQENIEKEIPSDYETIKKEIEQRDYEDMHRTISPLRKADDAKVLDTSDLSIEEVVAVVSKWIEEVSSC